MNTAYGTYPGLFHFNGPFWNTRLMLEICEHIESNAIPKSIRDDYLFVTVATSSDWLLERQMKAWNVPLVVLGKDLDGEYRHIYKITWILEELKKSDKEFIIYTDSPDSVFQTHPSVMVDRFDDYSVYGVEMLFSGEIAPWPRNLIELEEFEIRIASEKYGESSFIHLNSGSFVGKTDKVKEVLEYALNNVPDGADPDDDQGRLRLANANFYPKTDIDRHCEFFQTMSRVGTEFLEFH